MGFVVAEKVREVPRIVIGDEWTVCQRKNSYDNSIFELKIGQALQ